MRTILLSPEYPPALAMGGIGTHTATAADALVRQGHDVTVMTRGEAGTTDEDGVRVVRLRHRRLPGGVPRRDVIERMMAQVQVAWTCHRLRPEVVQAAEWQAQAWLIARLGRLPVVTRLATPTFMVDELNLEAGRHTTILRWMERDQARRSQVLYAPTRTIARAVSRRWGIAEGAIAIVPNPLNIEATRAAGALDSPIPMPRRSIVFIGRLEHRKGLAVLGRALPAVLEAHPEVEAVIIGRDVADHESDLMREFRGSAEGMADRVRFIGELPRPAALAVLARATVVALPSLWESFGYVCVEAMALGRPVVATGGSGFAEIIGHEQNGLLVPPGDAEALATALIELLGDDAKRQRLGKAAASRAEDFCAKRIAPEIEALHLRAINGTSSA